MSDHLPCFKDEASRRWSQWTTGTVSRVLVTICALLFLFARADAQAPGAALMPVIRQQFDSPSGTPLAGAKIYSYLAGTSTPAATYVDATLTIQNTNPVIADSGGFATIWMGAFAYKICVADQSNVQQYCTDNVSDPGQLLFLSSVVLNPVGRANQTVAGPLTADSFNGPATMLAPSVTLKTVNNPPTLVITQPAAAGQTYTIPDPTANANYVLSTGHAGTNSLDCTLGTLTCYRTASIYIAGAACNNATAFLGWDTFGANSPFPFCITGTNVQKAVMGLPGAYAHFQQNSGTSAAAGTITTTYPAATTAGSMLVASVAFNATTTITGCTDGTNAYSQAKHVATGALSVDIWVFHNAASKTAGTTLTCTYTAPASGAIKWHEYLVPNVTSTDQNASNTGSGTSVTTGTTASTAQNTELVFSAAGDLAGPTLVANSVGYADHGVVSNSTTVQVDDAGIIQQAISTQSTGFTLGTAQAWAAAVVTFKATNAGTVTGQRQIGLPAFFLSAQPVNSSIKWQNSEAVIGTSNTVLGAAVACTPDGSTDDPAFNAATTATVPASQTAANIILTTPLNALVSTGCTASGLMHFQVQRLRYNAADIFEGIVYVNGVLPNFGISQ